MSLLLVYLHEPRLLALELAAHDAGVAVERARNALFAQRRLEAWRPDVIVCGEQLEDVSGADFHRQLRADPTLADVTFVLLLPGGKAPFDTSPRDVVFDAALSPTELWRRLAPLAGAKLGGAPENDPGRTANPQSHGPQIRGAQMRGAQMRGSLAAFGLFELLGSLQQTHKSGQLSLHLGELDADFFLREGDIVHAEYLGLYGEAALLSAVDAARDLPDVDFTFEAWTVTQLNDLPHTVHRATERLLLEIAVRLDHERANRTNF